MRSEISSRIEGGLLARYGSLASAGDAMTAKSMFAKHAESAVGGLVEKYGFRPAGATGTWVRFDSPRASIDITYDLRQSHEVGIGLYENQNCERQPAIPYSLGEVFRACSVPNADRVSFFQGAHEVEAVAFVVEAVSLLEQYCKTCLLGAPAAFEALAHQRSREAAEYTSRMQVASVRDRAEAAWRSRDYRTFVELFDGLSSTLSEAEGKKLRYAMERCRTGS